VAYALTFVFENVGVGEEQYWAVNSKLGVDRDGNGPWPEGLISHIGGPLANGWMVAEVWESKGAQEVWMTNKLGPALAEVGVAPPTQLLETTPVQVHTA
jgi:hypothetical protein